jgi:hypothetical protein
LLRGELLLEPTQAGIPEVLHVVISLEESEFYLLGDGLSTALSAAAVRARCDVSI